MSQFSVPERWLEYYSVGKQIDNTPFVPFKCPLDEKFEHNIPANEKFGLAELKTLLPQVTLIIDLTNTAKYYNKNLLQNLGIEYEKIFCPGHFVPNEKLVERFFNVVDNFLLKNSGNKNNLIGVHCTHGVNRTGFFICSYMINKLGYNAKTAISEFNKARGHSLERINYINQLEVYEKHAISFSNEQREKTNNGYRRNRSEYLNQKRRSNEKFHGYPNFRASVCWNQSQFGYRRNQNSSRPIHDYSAPFDQFRNRPFSPNRFFQNPTYQHHFNHANPSPHFFQNPTYQHHFNHPNPCPRYFYSGRPSPDSFPTTY